MLSEKLKQQTEASHQKLEKHLVAKIKAIANPEDYANILNAFYGFIFPMEKMIAPYADAILTDHSKRRKSNAIAADMRHFDAGKTPAKEASGGALPTINSAASALGALYVLEGSTLGGEFITKMIAKKLAVKEDTGFAYFNSYGEKRMEMWERFKEALNKFGENGNEGEVICAADETFNQFYNWLNNDANRQ